MLLVEDDPSIREVATLGLEGAGFRVTAASDGRDALAEFRRTRFDLLLLDVMLPEMDGLEVCRVVRRESQVPIVMLSARSDTVDVVVGLELGADDYVTKPFSPRELVLRVDSVLRRAGDQGQPTDEPVQDGDLAVDPARHVATLAGRPLSLTGREFDLLRFLVANPGVAYTRDQLLQEVWGWSFGDHSTVTVHVRRLREKVERDPTSPSRLVTVWGVGYRWEPAGDA